MLPPNINNLDKNQTIVYDYDSWGKVISVTNANGEAMASNSIAMLNSVRYRGYVYDSETALYFVSRMTSLGSLIALVLDWASDGSPYNNRIVLW